MPRHYLTNKQRIAIQAEIRKRRQEKTLRYDDVAEWARVQLKLPFTPSRPVLSRLATSLSQAGDIPANDAKRNRQPAQIALENQLLQWVNDQNNSGRCLTGDVIKAKGKRLLEEVNRLLPESSGVDLTFSAGWLWRFQRRWNLKSRKLHGEAGDADADAVERELPNLRLACDRYAKEDVWNADETGLNYAMPPDRTISQAAQPGRKKDKKRLTLLVCANATGTEKFPLLYIGNAKKPRCFKKKTGADLGFDYASNKKAWMTMDIFFEWLKRFDAFIARTPNRRILLLLDNFSGHGSAECMPALANIEVKFLPPNTTSRLQPMDAGIIASLKRRYRTLQYNRVLDALDVPGVENNLYKIDQLTAMRYVQSVWEEMPSSIVANCWKSCGLFGAETLGRNDGSDAVASDTAALQSVITNLVGSQRRISISNLLNADDTDFLETFSEDSLAHNVIQELQGDCASTVDDSVDADGEEGSSIPLQEQLEAVKTCLLVAECQEKLNLQLVHHLRTLLRALRRQKASGMRQSTLEGFFRA